MNLVLLTKPNVKNTTAMKLFSILFLFFTFSIQAQSSFDIAEKLYQQKNYEKAKVAFEALVAKNANDLKAIEYLGDIACHDSDWDAALNYFKKLKTSKPSEADYVYKYGGALGLKAKDSNKFKALGMIGEVEESFVKAIKLNPNHVGARWALIELYLQLPGIVGGSEKKAQNYANELSKISPVDGYLSKGHIAEYFKRYPTAELYYKKAVQVGGSKTAYQKLADLYKNKMKQPQKATAVLDELKKKK